jgi:hypothetical protein
MMRQTRIRAIIAYQQALRTDPRANTNPPEGWTENQAQWNYHAKNKYTCPAEDVYDQDFGIWQEAGYLYRVLSDKQKKDLRKNWEEQCQLDPNLDKNCAGQQPEASLENAYHILVDGHVGINGDHRSRDQMNHWIMMHRGSNVARDLCMAFIKKCPKCQPAVKARTEGHKKRTAKRNAAKEVEAVVSHMKRPLEEEDYGASPEPAPKKRKTQTLKQRATAAASRRNTAQRSQSDPLQMGQSPPPVDQDRCVSDPAYAPQPFGQFNAPDNYNNNYLQGQMDNQGYEYNNFAEHQPEMGQLQNAENAQDWDQLVDETLEAMRDYPNFEYQPAVGHFENAYNASLPKYDHPMDPMLFQGPPKIQSGPLPPQQQEEVIKGAAENEYFDQNAPTVVDNSKDEPAASNDFDMERGFDFDKYLDYNQ